MQPQSVNTEQAVTLIKQQQPLILDTRDAHSFAQQHIAGAHNVTPDNVQILLSEHSPEQPILIYCYHGVGSLSWVSMLINAGFAKSYSLQGGFTAWAQHEGDKLLANSQ